MDLEALKELLEARIIANRTLMDERFNAQEKAITAALSAADRAVQKAETATEKRFDAVNEFRATLADQSRDFMNKDAAEVRFQGLDEKITALKELAAAGSGRSSAGAQLVAWGLAAIAVLVSVTALLAAHPLSLR
jgi:hypothetical protein